MSKKVFVVVICLLLGICTIGSLQNKDPRDFFSILLTPEQQAQSGLHKLSQKERSSLSNLLMEMFNVFLHSKKMGDSALEYLKNDGWKEVKVLGTHELKIDEWSDTQEYLIVEEGIWTYILEPRTLFFSLAPGKYLGKMGLTSCEIIDSDGDTIEFWTKDTR